MYKMNGVTNHSADQWSTLSEATEEEILATMRLFDTALQYELTPQEVVKACQLLEQALSRFALRSTIGPGTDLLDPEVALMSTARWRCQLALYVEYLGYSVVWWVERQQARWRTRRKRFARPAPRRLAQASSSCHAATREPSQHSTAMAGYSEEAV